MKEKVYILTLGCPKNEADMDILKGIFLKKGYLLTNNPEEADYSIVDTCGFIEPAKKESINEIFNIVSLKEKNPDMKIIPIGCLIERYYDELKKELTEVDGLIGVVPPEKIVESIENGNFYLKLPKPYDVYKCDYRRIPDTPYAYIKIADGCNRKCAFCSIPYFKGEPVSRDIKDIKKEAEFLIKNGIKEIILVSQDNTLYGIDLYKKQALPDLLKDLNSIEGDFWIRVMYLHPDFINNEIIESINTLDKVIPYFDIPIQHGSDKILKLMGRIKKSDELKNLIFRIRNNPEAIIRTTLIAGFPGETDDDFEKLLSFIDEIEFDKLGAFMYFDEEGTPSHLLPEKIDEKTKEKRFEKLMELQKEISTEKLERFIGKQLKVLIEEKENNVYIGRAYLDAPEIDGNVFFKSERNLNIGDFVVVKILNSSEYDLEGVAI
ncbi:MULTISPECIES: 30S ribosomal protein S12 methylthiotransferase RimO [unclassified Marinitoga]|uniref:30S ribosomal protein S12 methylthiotransferase RimO n=1 Tax=unclassified Marinitoga TaxID=2640159 RepID=UPI000640F9A2|nr:MULTISPECIES: 30S ribosomal protein S12 methylthiotransferase RimO [unclassified Marinitoga]KLO21395.1 ribosomal protein S12 methylthiotransferase RimO [Marinitoga sp. 1155]NUU99820.1 ribosomal protein S12 methylthiotransferase RimO [Marinitoga sp. 1154]